MKTLRLPTLLLLGAAGLPRANAQVPPEAADDEPAGYTPATSSPGLTFGGYLDVGFADAQGNGTSFHPADTRLPADYGVDTFATAINSRGEVASTDAGGRFTNGFVPRSAGIGGRPTALINTVSFDVKYEAPSTPVMVFSRVQLMPRFGDRGSESRVLLEQAFGRLIPFDTQELALSVGKIDSVFGVEYLENQANLRTGITPSLLARYTTGTPVGAKLFYRLQIAPLWSALSLNAAATNAPPFVDSLQAPEVSLTGRPVASGRLGYELNLPGIQLKLGGSAMAGPRNDQGDPDAAQRALGADARASLLGLSLTGEWVKVDQDAGTGADKQTGLGLQTLASAFHARGFYVVAAWEVPWALDALRKATIYGRFEQRRAWFEGFTALTVRRITAGLRLDLWELLALKGEYLLNQEVDGAPNVDNDVVVASAVLSF